jgi:hypothetical protein
MLSQSFDFLLLGLQHLLNQEHLSLLLDEFPSILSIFWSLDGDGESSSFGHVDFTLHLWVDSKLCWLNVSFTNFPQAAFSSWFVFLPYF